MFIHNQDQNNDFIYPSYSLIEGILLHAKMNDHLVFDNDKEKEEDTE